MENNNNEVIEREIQIKVLSQKFYMPLVLCLISILLATVDTFLSLVDDESRFVTVMSGLIYIGILLELRKYLKNLNKDNAGILINWIITANVLSFILYIFNDYYPLEDTFESDFLLIGGLILIIGFYILEIWLGIILQKIKNDPSRYLNTLGATFSYLAPVSILLLVLYAVTDNLLLNFAFNITVIIPSIVMLLMFHRLWVISASRK